LIEWLAYGGSALYGGAVSAWEADIAGRRPPRRYAGQHCAPAGWRVGAWCAAGFIAVIAAYPFLSPFGRMVDFLIGSLAPLPTVFIGLRRTAPADRGPWWLLVGALVSLNAGNIIWYWYAFGLGERTGDGTIASAFAALGQILMFCAAVTVVARRGRSDIGGMIDTTIVSMAVGGVLWDFLILPHMRATRADDVTQVVTCIAVFMLTGILGALGRLLSTAKESISALWLLLAAMSCSLSGIVGVAMLIDPVTSARPAWTDMAYLGGYMALGLFGLDRSVGRMLRPGPAPTDNLSNGRLVFLGLALVAMPLVGSARQVAGQTVDGVLLAVVAAMVTPLVMVRVGRLAAERSWAEWALRYQASHDGLTGLPNRPAFAARLTAALDERRPLVVLFCDLDGFKGVNDRHGHAAGDQVLVEVAARLRRCIREGDVASRFGGDEFVIMCLDAEPGDGAELVRRIEAALAVPIELEREPVLVGASIGTATADGAMGAEALIQRADVAMYEAKHGRQGSPGVRAVAA
jgi:diguanylate cyclase (GGDEF)-like protein